MSEESTTVSPANASPAAAPSLTVQKFTTPDYREPDPFEGPKLKIERAKRHIADFREAFKTLANSNIMRIDPEIDKETGATRIYARLTQPLPSDLRLTAADAL